MKMLPSHIWSTSYEAKGEPQVFRLLEQFSLSKECVGMHTLNLVGDGYQRWYELDFLIVSQAAIFGLEVKAGRVTCRDGTWRVHKKNGQIAYEKHKSPLTQASDSLERLRSGFIKQHFGSTYEKVPFVKLAVLCSNNRPDRFIDYGAEMQDELVVYEEDLNEKRLKERLNVAADFARKNGPRRFTIGLTEDEVCELVAAIRPNLDKTYPSRAGLEFKAQQQDSLTEEQYRIADAMNNAERYLVDGGAGTGKTFLLMYDAQRKAASGSRVGVLTPNKKLSDHLAEQLGKDAECLSPSDDFQHVLPYDVLYVDEAQDFINARGFDLVDSLVQGGLDSGSWRIYGDFQNQRGVSVIWEEEVWDLFVSATGNKALVPLRRNVRNTTEIVRWLEIVCGARVGETESRGAGAEVEVVAQEQGMALLLGKTPHRIFGVLEPKDVMILYPTVAEGGLSDRLRGLQRRFQVSDIESFRGLESLICYVVGIESCENLFEVRDQLYKGVSRARAICLIEGDENRLLSLFSEVTTEYGT